MSIVNLSNLETPPDGWNDFCVDLIGKEPDDVARALTEKLDVASEKLTPVKDLLENTAKSLAHGDIVSEEKVRRRLGLEYGPLTAQERELLRAEAAKVLPVLFEECEGDKLPLAAMTGYGSTFDLRMGLSGESDLDINVIPLGDQEDGTRACWKLNDPTKTTEISGRTIPRVDAHSDWMTGKWLETNISNPEKVKRVREQFEYMKPGSVLVVRNQAWKDLLEKAVDFEGKGVVVEVLDYE